MKIFTSYFAKSAKHPRAIAISVGVPSWYDGDRYPELAPTRPTLKMLEQDYTRVYLGNILSRLDPIQVANDLGDGAVLLCWEKPGEFCHRQIVAKWLRDGAGIECEELDTRPAPKFNNVKPATEQMTLF